MAHTGLEKSLKNGTVLENSLNFKISAFVLEKYCLEFCQKLLEILQISLNFCLNKSMLRFDNLSCISYFFKFYKQCEIELKTMSMK